jgi:diketogulonate reductase-like aldo/keto reductase
MAPTQPIFSYKLNDGTSIPWLGWGPGSLEPGKLAVEAGINHIDTAQIYGTEEDTGKIIAGAPIPKAEIHVTSKRKCVNPSKRLLEYILILVDMSPSLLI